MRDAISGCSNGDMDNGGNTTAKVQLEKWKIENSGYQVKEIVCPQKKKITRSGYRHFEDGAMVVTKRIKR